MEQVVEVSAYSIFLKNNVVLIVCLIFVKLMLLNNIIIIRSLFIDIIDPVNDEAIRFFTMS